MSEQVCWFCDAEEARTKREPYSGLPFLFAAVMPYEKMMAALCVKHRAAMEFVQAKAAGRDIIPRQDHEQVRK